MGSRGSEPNDSSGLPCSYVAVPDAPNSNSSSLMSRNPFDTPLKLILVVFCVFLLFVSLASFNSYNKNSTLPPNYPPECAKFIDSHPNLLASTKWSPVSRGVSAGVSEKANKFGGLHAAQTYPWDNCLLSFQRTGFHFQPESNWMNGISISYTFKLFYSSM